MLAVCVPSPTDSVPPELSALPEYPSVEPAPKPMSELVSEI